MDTARAYSGRTGRDSFGDFKLTIFWGSAPLEGIGSGSKNRTVVGADLRLRLAPIDFEDFNGDFIEDRLMPTETSLLADESCG